MAFKIFGHVNLVWLLVDTVKAWLLVDAVKVLFLVDTVKV